jgi:hypothetical protein
MNQTVYQIITYGAFFDVPRGLFTCINGKLIELICEFNDKIDDYENFYFIFEMEGISCEEAISGAFFHYYNKCKKNYIGTINISEIIFDKSRRKSFSSDSLLTKVKEFNINSLPEEK